MTRYTILVLLAVFMVTAMPQSAAAYKTHDQKAVRINEQTAFYTISYRFGIPQRDFYLPIGAVRDATKDDGFVLGYEFLEDGKTYTNKGTSAGIVLSDAEVVDGQYFIPAGKFRTFTLFVMLTTDETDPEMDYALHVNSLPFIGIINGERVDQKLYPTELQYYLTPEIELNESNWNNLSHSAKQVFGL